MKAINSITRSKSENLSRAARRALCGLVACLALTTAAFATAAEPTPTETKSAVTEAAPRMRLRIAVDQFKWDEIRGHPRFDYFYGSLHADLRQGLQAALIEKLAASGHFQVMEREATALKQMKMEDGIDEQKRAGQAGAATVETRQKRTPAQFIVTPTITGLQITGDEGNGTRVMGVGVQKRKTSVTLTMNIRIYDAQTSALLETATAVGTQETTEKNVAVQVAGLPLPPLPGLGRVFGARSGNAEVNSSKKEATPFAAVVEAVLKDAVEKIAGRLSKEPWSALIAARDSSTGRVIINAGTDAGVSVGQLFDVMKAGGVVLDPDTGDVLTRGDEAKVGKVRVVRVERNVAFCDVLEGQTLEPKNVIRIALR